MTQLLSFAHLIGFALAVGAATAKFVLLLRCQADRTFVPVYFRVAKAVTRQIVLGVILLTLSGIGWLLVGYPFTTRLVVKLVLFAATLVLGPIMDNVVEPRFQRLAPATGQPPSPAFIGVQRQFVILEAAATALFYLIVVIWVLV